MLSRDNYLKNLILKRDVIFLPAFDKRNADPEKNCGIHGVEINFILSGQEGAITFILYTNWHLPHVNMEYEERPFDGRFPRLFYKPIPGDLSYHSRIGPNYEGQQQIVGCKWLDGALCYSDGSSLCGVEVFEILVARGEEAFWGELESYYDSRLRVP